MPTVRTDDDVRISYKTIGDGPRDLLFLHGWGGSGSYFDEMLKHVDLNACAQSFRATGGMAIQARRLPVTRWRRFWITL